MAETNLGSTQFFSTRPEQEMEVKQVLDHVYNAMEEKGYNPVNQIVGYLLTEDPTYITTNHNARSVMLSMDRDDILMAMVNNFIS